jgi:hypothetical protein
LTLLAEEIWKEISIVIGLYHPLDGIANPKYKQLPFLTNEIFFTKRRRYKLLTGKGAAI